MPCFFDRFDYFGMFFGDKTENEECCLRSYFIQNLQQFSTDNRNSVFKSVPLGIRNLKTLIPILKVNR